MSLLLICQPTCCVSPTVRLQKDVQSATLTVRKDAAFGIKFNGVQAALGESVEVKN
nr:hypothetical protein [Escherichia coli]